jgi:hypothetical protein
LFFFFLSVFFSSFFITIVGPSSSLFFHGFLSFLLTFFSLNSQGGLHACYFGSVLKREIVAAKASGRLFFRKRKGTFSSPLYLYPSEMRWGV